MRFGTFSYNQARPSVAERQAFEELLAQIEFTERLGFNEAWFAEHHHSDYGLLASPNLIIAALARRTERLRFGNLVSVLPLYDPMRLAEECAILARLYQVLEELPTDQRLAWSLRYLEGEPLDAVAAASGCSLSTAKRRVGAAKSVIDEVFRDE